MADLTEQHLDDLLSGYSGVTGTDDVPRMVGEIRRHRVAMKRLDRLSEHMETNPASGLYAVAGAIRAAINGDANG